jgi:hypothetical protein
MPATQLRQSYDQLLPMSKPLCPRQMTAQFSVVIQKSVKLFVTFFAVIPAEAGIQSL